MYIEILIVLFIFIYILPDSEDISIQDSIQLILILLLQLSIMFPNRAFLVYIIAVPRISHFPLLEPTRFLFNNG